MSSLTGPSDATGGNSTYVNAAYVSGVPMAEQVSFDRLCHLFEQINITVGRDNKRRKAEICSMFINKWRQLDVKPPGHTMHQLIRLMVPDFDNVRKKYHLKESAMARVYIKAIGVAKESDTAHQLNNWKNPRIVRNAGDFGAVVEEVLQRRSNPTKQKLSIAEVNALLDDLVLSGADKSKPKAQKQEEIFRVFVTRMSALENKWIVKIILKALKMGMTEGSVLQCLHPDANDVYNVSSDIVKICTELTDPNVRSTEKSIKLFSSFLPMLAGRGHVEDTMKNMDNEPFDVELKLDGERILLHRDGERYFYSSRNNHDYTKLYGGSPRSDGCLTRFIHSDCFVDGVRNIILDGEMVTVDEDGKIMKFGNLKTVANRNLRSDHHNDDDGNEEEDDGPTHARLKKGESVRYVVFDLLYLNDVCLTGRPLHERRALLAKYVKPKLPHLMIITHTRVNNMNELYDQLNKVIDSGEEGLVAKRPNSLYVVNQRKEQDWQKIKGEYIHSLGDDLDVLIVGAFLSDGFKRGGKLSHFMCAVLDETSVQPTNVVEDPLVQLPSARFFTFNKFGSGLTDTDMQILEHKLAKHWIPWNKDKVPKWLVHSSQGEKPDYYIEPQQ